MLTGSFVGKGLRANLTDGVLRDFQIREDLFKEYIGGYGLAVRLILEEQPLKADPLGEKNFLAFAPGLLSGTDAPFSGRFSVAGKSPLTGGWGDANAGGYFGPELKKSGYDILIVSGVSPKPVYIWINNGHAELRDATSLWGKDSVEAELLIRNELNEQLAQVACIGQAGEKRSLISCVMTNGGRAAARSGLGAVMGSKGLKAVAVRGERTVSVANEDLFKGISSTIRSRLKSSFLSRLGVTISRPITPLLLRIFGSRLASLSSGNSNGMIAETFRQGGTALGLAMAVASGDAPVKNWSGVGVRDFPPNKADKISGASVTRYQKTRYSCASCPLGCGGLLDVEDGSFAAVKVKRPEYETLAAFGPILLNSNLESIIKANDLCNRYGMDTISAGAAIAFAFECYENGLITSEETGGSELKWGDPAQIISLLTQMGAREALGDVLADGVKKAAERIGKGSEKYAIHIGGQEPAMHDPRVSPSIGATYVIDAAPGRHTAGGASFAESMGTRLPLNNISLPKIQRYRYTGKGTVHRAWSNYIHAVNSLGLCEFGTSGLITDLPVIKLVNAATGWDLDEYGLLTIGERIQTARHLFNLTEGVDPKHSVLPNRLKGIPPLDAGPSAGVTIDLDALVRDYYNTMDWDPVTAWPSDEQLQALGLIEVIRERKER
ncbi:MAG: aldehyde ferredoxin oxidoreductase family protein [Thaumarchaeota archaeon]|nr:aldehyde ferredoxin oxidoreductase family protein [Nitrososphaerota archaeon]MCL5318495.1 aldehyde ferredoxin oxidoreductase family protein [Nitrososphaerota archaeon]